MTSETGWAEPYLPAKGRPEALLKNETLTSCVFQWHWDEKQSVGLRPLEAQEGLC